MLFACVLICWNGTCRLSNGSPWHQARDEKGHCDHGMAVAAPATEGRRCHCKIRASVSKVYRNFVSVQDRRRKKSDRDFAFSHACYVNFYLKDTVLHIRLHNGDNCILARVIREQILGGINSKNDLSI